MTRTRLSLLIHSIRRPRGTGGTVPQKNLRWGDGPCIRPPNILRSSVVGCPRKYKQSKKGVIKEFFSEIVVFLVKKGSCTTFNTVKIWKIRKTWSMTKKGHQKFLACKWTFFPKKPHSKILVLEKFFCPPKLG